MEKYDKSEIKSFEFSDLKGAHVITQGEFKSFTFETITGDVLNSTLPSEETVRQERGYEQKKNFKIDEIVRDYRGLSRQEKNDLEHKIQEEVKKRLDATYEAAFKEGLDKGFAEGEKKASEEFVAIMETKVEEFSQVVIHIQGQSKKIIESNRQEIYDFVKRFTKWIVLKEINEKKYLETLLEKLILELNTQKNLIIKIGKDNFAQMPEVVSSVEAKLGQLTNVRIEIVPEIQHPGIILESENGLIDGSLESVFKNIDKIFEQVAVHE